MVSIIIPCYNQGEYLLQAVENLEPRENKLYEVIIVDDGSYEEETLKAFSLLEERGYKIIHQENLGLAKARNIGIENASRDYILPLDADNIISLSYLERATGILENDPEVGVVYSDLYRFGKINDELRLPDFSPERFLAVNFIDACAVFRKSIWKRAGGYDTSYARPGL